MRKLVSLLISSLLCCLAFMPAMVWAAPTEDPVEVWLCGRQPVLWQPASGLITLGADQQQLVRLHAAWQRGDTHWQTSAGETQATLTWRGQVQAPCSLAGQPVVPYWASDASGRAWLNLSAQSAHWGWPGQQGRMSPLPLMEPIPGGWQMTLRGSDEAWRVTIMAQACRRSPSAATLPHKVAVWQEAGPISALQPIWQGCGGDVKSQLLSVGWQVVQIQGAAIHTSTPPTLTFHADGQVEGSTGCNAYVGTFVLNGSQMQIDQWRRTQKPCATASLQGQETTFAAIVQGVRSYDFDREGYLVLFSTAGTLKAMAQTPWSPAAVANPP